MCDTTTIPEPNLEPGCYPVVYDEVASSYSSPNYTQAKQICSQKTTKTNCLDQGYPVWNQERPGLEPVGPWASPVFAYPDLEMDGYAWSSYGSTSHLVIDILDLDTTGLSLPYYSGQCDINHEGVGCYRSLGPVCAWGVLNQ